DIELDKEKAKSGLQAQVSTLAAEIVRRVLEPAGGARGTSFRVSSGESREFAGGPCSWWLCLEFWFPFARRSSLHNKRSTLSQSRGGRASPGNWRENPVKPREKRRRTKPRNSSSRRRYSGSHRRLG